MASPFETLFGGAPERVDPTAGFKSYFNTAGSLNTLRDQRIKNALNQIKLNYAPQMAQQGADLGAANVSIKQNEAKYAPQMSLADLAQKHAQTIYENAEATKSYLQSQGVKLDNITKQAEANGAPEKVKNALQLQKAQIQATYAKANAASNTAAAAMVRTIAPKDRAAWMASHPGFVQHLNQVANMGAAPQATNAPFPSPQAAQSSQNMPNAATAMQSSTQPPQTQAQPQLQLSPADQTFQLGNQMEANKNAVSSQDTRKLGASIEIEKFLQNPELDTWAAAMAKYSGIAGKGKAAIEQWKRDNPEDYERNLFGRNQFKSALVNQNKNLEGLGVQLGQREELTGNIMQAFDQYSSNPKRALDQWQRTKHLFHLISLANSTAAQPLYPGVREKAAGLSFDDKTDLNQMVDIKVNGRRAQVPLKNLHKALSRAGVEMDLGD